MGSMRDQCWMRSLRRCALAVAVLGTVTVVGATALPASAVSELVTNGSFEVIDPATARPPGWTQYETGKLNASYSVRTGDAPDGTRHARVVVKKHFRGDA